MRARHHTRLDLVDQALSRDPVLSKTAGLFVTQPAATELLERPRPPMQVRRLPRLRQAVCTPEFLMVAAVTVLVVSVLLGGLLHNDAIAVCGLAAPILLGVGCYFATRAHRARQRNF